MKKEKGINIKELGRVREGNQMKVSAGEIVNFT